MAVMTAIAIGGLALSAYQQVRQGRAIKQAGQAERAAADSQAEILDYNATIADAQAADAVTRGQEEENRYRQGVRSLIGSQRAGFAGQGVDVGVGSAADVQADSAFLGELDALTIRTNAAREAWGYKVQAADTRKRAEVTRKTGVFAERAANAAGNSAYVGAGATIASGAGSLLEARYGFGRGRSAA